MQVLLTSAITKVANEKGILNCSLVWAFMILFSYRRFGKSGDLMKISQVEYLFIVY